MKRPDVDAIRKRTEAASPGPWRTEHGSVYDRSGWYLVRGGKIDASTMSALEQPANVELIAHARTDLADLVGYALALEARIRELEDRVRDLAWAAMGDDL